MELVVIESPFAPANDPEARGLTDAEYKEAIAENIAYAKAAVRDCLARNEAPYASHLFFPQEGMLDDRDKEQRRVGIEAGLLWATHAAKTVVYVDRGFSNGVNAAIERSTREGRPIVYRSLVTGKESTTYSKALLVNDEDCSNAA